MKNFNCGLLAILITSSNVFADQHALFNTPNLTPEIALKAATAALDKCRDEGYQVAVAITDRSGNLQALIRDRYAGAHTPETARRKAWTAASFKTNTTEMAENTKHGSDASGIRFVSEALMIGGGMVIDAGGTIAGAIGVSGAPGGDADDLCASAGIAAIEEDVLF